MGKSIACSDGTQAVRQRQSGLGTSGAKLIESMALNPADRTYRDGVRLGWRSSPQRRRRPMKELAYEGDRSQNFPGSIGGHHG